MSMKSLFLFLCLLVVSLNVRAEIFQIEDIRVDGLERVSSGTIFSSLTVSVGDTIDSENIRNLTRDLFRLGFFDDILILKSSGSNK